MLLYLVRNRGRLVGSKNRGLFENVWANVVVTDNSLVQCIKEIRQALGDDRQTMIETVAKRGYVFTPAVDEGDDASASAAISAPSGGVASSQQPVSASCRPVIRLGWA